MSRSWNDFGTEKRYHSTLWLSVGFYPLSLVWYGGTVKLAGLAGETRQLFRTGGLSISRPLPRMACSMGLVMNMLYLRL